MTGRATKGLVLVLPPAPHDEDPDQYPHPRRRCPDCEGRIWRFEPEDRGRGTVAGWACAECEYFARSDSAYDRVEVFGQEPEPVTCRCRPMRDDGPDCDEW